MSDDPISRAIANARKAPRAAEVVPLRPQPPAAPLPPEPPPVPRAPVGPQVFEHSSSGVPTKVAIYPAGSGPQSPGAPQIGAAQVHSAPPPGGIAGQSGTQVRMYPAGTGPQPSSQSSAGSMDPAALLPAEVFPAAGTRDALELLIQRLEAGIPKARELIAHPVHRTGGKDLAAVVAACLGETPAQVRARWGQAEPPKAAPGPELGPAARRAVRDAHMRRMAAAAEEAAPAPAGMRRRTAPGRKPPPTTAKRTERRAEFERELARRGRRGMQLTDFEGEVIGQANAIVDNPRKCVEAIGRLPREYARRVRRAALRSSSGHERGWESIVARRTVAYAVALYRTSRRTTRRGYATATVGVTVGMLCSLIKNPQTHQPYSKSAVVGRLHDGTELAPIAALVEAKAFLRTQPPAHEVPPHLRGRDRDGCERAVGQFWFPAAAVTEYVEDRRAARRKGAFPALPADAPTLARPPDAGP